MARKGWASLSPAYRTRLEKAGLSQSDYESGASISKARGHEKTPERPHSFDAARFPEYSSERDRLIQDLEAKKERMFGDRPRWSAKRSARYIREKPPSMRQLRWAVDEAEESDFIDALRESPETFTFLGYG